MDGKAGGSSPGALEAIISAVCAFRSFALIYLDVYYVPRNSVLVVPNSSPHKGFTMGVPREASSWQREQPWGGPERGGAGRSECGTPAGKPEEAAGRGPGVRQSQAVGVASLV